MVKRAAVGGEGYVLDHMSREAIDNTFARVGDALLGGFVDAPPYAIFSDSLEVYGSDWTPHLPEEFQEASWVRSDSASARACCGWKLRG